MGIKATNLLKPEIEVIKTQPLALETLVSREPIKIDVQKAESGKHYTNSEYVDDALRFLLESGIISSTEALPEGWRHKLYEGMGGGREAIRSRKWMGSGEGEAIRKKLRCEERMVHGKMTGEVDIYLLRQLTAAVLREKLPPNYKSPPETLSFPQISRILGYTSHASSVNAHTIQGPRVRTAIDSMNARLE